MKFTYWLVLGWACAWPLAASAQWQWTDNSGRRVFSDQPPPADVPEKNILRRAGPTPAPLLPNAPDAPASAGTPPLPADTPKPSDTDKALAGKARKAKEEEKTRQTAQAQKMARAKADNCARARQSEATLGSGMRIAQVNAQGEREIMDDKARADERRRIAAVIARDCQQSPQ